jgi:hypothetical protein
MGDSGVRHVDQGRASSFEVLVPAVVFWAAFSRSLSPARFYRITRQLLRTKAISAKLRSKTGAAANNRITGFPLFYFISQTVRGHSFMRAIVNYQARRFLIVC